MTRWSGARQNQFFNFRQVPQNLPSNYRSSSREVKALDLTQATYQFDTTGSIIPLNLMQAGSSFFNRIGRKIEMKNIRIVGNILPLRTGAEDYARIMIVYDRQTNGAIPAMADMLETTPQNGTNNTTSYSGINLNNRDRFTLLRDMRLALPSVSVAGTVQTNLGIQDPVCPLCNIDMFVKLKGMVTQFKADSSPAVIGDVATGAIYLVTFALYAPGVAAWQIQLESRLRYNDL